MVSDDKLKLLLKHITAPKQQQGVDNRGIIGAMLTALGVNQARVVPDAIKRLQFEKADALKNWSSGLPKPGQFKPYDIMLRTGAGVGELEPANLDWKKITGQKDTVLGGIGRRLYEMTAGKRDNHAYILLPYERTVDGHKITDLVPTIIGNNKAGAKIAANPELAAAMLTWQKSLKRMRNQGIIPALRNIPGDYEGRLQVIRRAGSNPTQFGSWNELIEQNYGGVPDDISQFMKDDHGTYRFLRFKEELTPTEMEEVKKRLSGVMGQTFLDEDNTVSGIKNLFAGPGKSRPTFNPNQKIPTCSGGVCYAFEGLRDMPSVDRALPQDLAKHPSLREVGNFYRGKVSPSRSGRIGWVPDVDDAGEQFLSPMLRQSQKAVSDNSIRAARRALTFRTGMAAVPLGVGGYMLGSSPTFQKMVQPLAEQGQLIGDQVKELVNQARRYNRSTPHQAL